MSNEHASNNIDRVKEDSKIWEGGFGRSRFRALWDRGPGYAQFQMQGPFTQIDDPDGIGVPFSSDFGIVWEREHGARISGEYWNNLRGRANRSIHQVAEIAQRKAKRALRNIAGNRWRSVGREVRTIAEKALVELEESFAHMRQKQSTNQSGSQTNKNERGPKAQRIPIEYDKPDDLFDDDSDRDSMDIAFPKPLSKDERDARRRAILEDLRAGTISLEEAELRLMNPH
jgi:hypothetical protein